MPKLVYGYHKYNAIKEGWKNVLKQRMSDEDVRRSKICAGCTQAVKKSFIFEVGDKLKEVDGLVCDLCSCPLISKIRQDKIICEKWRPSINPK